LECRRSTSSIGCPAVLSTRIVSNAGAAEDAASAASDPADAPAPMVDDDNRKIRPIHVFEA
jgi:hypothetical protein